MQITSNDIIAVFRQAKIVREPENLRTDIKLTDQGVDSLGMFSLLLALQDKYGIEIPDADIDQVNTIDALVVYLNDRLN